MKTLRDVHLPLNIDEDIEDILKGIIVNHLEFLCPGA